MRKCPGAYAQALRSCLLHRQRNDPTTWVSHASPLMMKVQPMLKSDEITKATAIDPVCHMRVDPESAAGSFEFEGQTYYFCARHCLHKFTQNPKQFLQPAPTPIGIQPVSITRAKDKSPFTCPMHPEVENTGPGSCPKCGMALEPAIYTPQSQTKYTCHMHPEIALETCLNFRG